MRVSLVLLGSPSAYRSLVIILIGHTIRLACSATRFLIKDHADGGGYPLLLQTHGFRAADQWGHLAGYCHRRHRRGDLRQVKNGGPMIRALGTIPSSFPCSCDRGPGICISFIQHPPQRAEIPEMKLMICIRFMLYLQTNNHLIS